MSFRNKQFLSAFLTASLVLTFVGCILFCGDAADCAEDFSTESLIERHYNIEDHPSEESCPIGISAKTTAPERLPVNLDFTILTAKKSQIFSAPPVLSFVLKNYAEFYRPPENLLPPSRLRVLRI